MSEQLHTVDAIDQEDGTVLVRAWGNDQVLPTNEDALRYLHIIARDSARQPVRVRTSGAENVVLIVEPAGTYYREGAAEQRRPIPGTPPAGDHSTSWSNGPGLLGDPVDEPPAPNPSSPPAPPAAAPVDQGRRQVPAPPLTPPTSAPAAPPPAPATVPSMVAGPGEPRHHQRRSFIDVSPTVEPARQGWQGALNRLGLRLDPGPAEQDWRADAAAAEQHWPGPRTIAITNPKGGSGKTPSTALLSALFARYGGAGVLAWDNNETRGTLAWRTEQGAHQATALDLLPKVDQLLSTSAQSAEMSYFAHHQRKDKYDVLQSDQSVEGDHEISAADVESIHHVASRFYRMIIMDSGNSERAANWRAMIERTNALVVPCTNRADTAENGARMLDALKARDERSRHLAENAVVIVSNATGKKADARIKAIAEDYRPMVREVVTIPYDPALVEGVIHFDALRPATQRAWLRAAAAVARGL